MNALWTIVRKTLLGGHCRGSAFRLESARVIPTPTNRRLTINADGRAPALALSLLRPPRYWTLDKGARYG